MKAPGDRIGRFRIERLLGEGGVAQVYRVRHELLDTVHALKLLPVARRGLAKRLVQEGRIQAHLRHPNVVAVTDLVEEKGQIGLVMEFIEGYSLEECLREGGAMATEEAMDLFGQVLSGVAAAHQAGVLHRDLKPANVLLTAADERVVAKVSDFGIAKMASGPEEMRGNRKPIGTPGYMAPEQITNSDSSDRRSDVFALGAILYEMLSGRRTFAGRTAKEVMGNTARSRFTPLREVVRGCPEEADLAVRKALQVEPEDRFQSCMEMARALGIQDAIVPLKTIPPSGEDGLGMPEGAYTPYDDRSASMPTIVHAGRGFDEGAPTMMDGAGGFEDDGGVLSSYDDVAAHPTLTPDDITGDHGPAFNTASDFLDSGPKPPARTPKIGWGRDEAVDTWAPDDSEDGFALPQAAQAPRAAPPEPRQQRRAQAWSPPGASARPASNPAPEPARPKPQARPKPAPRPAPEPEPVRPVSVGHDVSSAIAESLHGGPSSRDAIEPDDDFHEEEEKAKKKQQAKKERAAAASKLKSVFRTLLITAIPLSVLALLFVLVAAYGSQTLAEFEADTARQEAVLNDLIDDHEQMVADFIALSAPLETEDETDPAVQRRAQNAKRVEQRLATLKAAPDFAERQRVSEEMVDFMINTTTDLTNHTETELVGKRRNLDLLLADIQKSHEAYHASVEAWRQETLTPIGNITLMVGLSDPPPESAEGP